jgi:hypothetical protein
VMNLDDLHCFALNKPCAAAWGKTEHNILYIP